MKLLLGDCLEKLKELEDNSVDAVVTDPPYGLEFMGKEWDSFKTGRIAKYKEGGSLDIDAINSRSGKGGAGPSYTKRAAKRCRNCGKQEWSGSPCKCDNPDFEIDNSTQLTFQEFNEAWARECYRVLKPGGHLLAFAGSRMYHRLAVGVEDAGFEIRDQIMWIYGSGFPKSHNIGNKLGEEYKGIGTALKPAHEPIVMARKPFKGSVAQNVLEWGTGGINIDGCRIGTEKVSAHHAPKGTFAGGDYDRGSDTNYYENEGRFPANIIFDEEAGKLLDQQSGITSQGHWPKGKTKGFGEFGGGESSYEGVGPKDKEKGGASRFFYCPKASKKDRNEGCDKLEEKMSAHSVADKCAKCGKFLGASANVCKCEEPERIGISSKNNHPTVKPTDLMAYLIRLVTPKGGIVLDPFMGSGSTGKAAVREGMEFIGIEREAEYMEIAKHRIEYELDKKQLEESKRKFW